MFTVTPNGENRLDIEISGKINSFDMKSALNKLFEASKDIQNGRILYVLKDIDLPSFGALGVELMYLPNLFQLLKRFDRVAVVTDTRWAQKASQIENMFLPGLEIKAFDMKSIGEAQSWLQNS